jgi:hypothetical protein
MDDFPRLNPLNGGFSPDLFSLLLIIQFSTHFPLFSIPKIKMKQK